MRRRPSVGGSSRPSQSVVPLPMAETSQLLSTRLSCEAAAVEGAELISDSLRTSVTPPLPNPVESDIVAIYLCQPRQFVRGKV